MKRMLVLAQLISMSTFANSIDLNNCKLYSVESPTNTTVSVEKFANPKITTVGNKELTAESNGVIFTLISADKTLGLSILDKANSVYTVSGFSGSSLYMSNGATHQIACDR